MTLDLLDRAFLARFVDDVAEPAVAIAAESLPLPDPGPMAPPSPQPATSLLDRLIAAVPHAWCRLAAEVEEAHAAGCRVIAVAGSHRGEGRTTLARGLVRTLAERGHRVAIECRTPLAIPCAEDDTGPADIVIVDAGIWFPPGPIRRQSLARIAFGCDAAILVRRADRCSCAAHGEALAAIGLRVIGEAITFERPIPDGGPEPRHD